MPLTAASAWLGGLKPSAGIAQADLRIRGPIGKPELRGEVSVHGGMIAVPWLEPPLREIEAMVMLEGERTRVPSWHGRLAEGAIRGTAEVVRAGQEWGVTTSFALDGGRAEQILGYLRGKGELTGRLSVTGTMTFKKGVKRCSICIKLPPAGERCGERTPRPN
jgi:hypothetical protein